MQIIVTNYSRNGLALITEVKQQAKLNSAVMVVNINTGWQSQAWLSYEHKVKAYVEELGFKTITLQPKQSFTQLVEARNEFPTLKFQWCATFLKGMTLLTWLQKIDPAGQAEVLLSAHRALGGRYRYLKASINSSEHYGGRKVSYPLINKTPDEINALLQDVEFSIETESKECRLCVLSQLNHYTQLTDEDFHTLSLLEKKINHNFNPDLVKQVGAKSSIEVKQRIQQAKYELHDTDASNVVQAGCGAPYGCGL